MNPTNLTRRCLSVFVLVSTLLCLPILLGTSFVASAQTTAGRLVVTVKDPTDAVVAGATVTATNEGTAQSITVTTNEKGVAIFPQLLVATYTVVAEAEGFQKTQTEGLKIDVGQEYGAVLVLQPGVAENIITVTAGEALVQTTNAELASTVNQKQVQELPLDGRNPLALIQLQAGVNQSGNTTTVINGFRTSTSTLTQDGINIQDNFIRANGLDFTPNRTSVAQTQEFTVITQNPDASIAGSSSVRGVSPSGTNELHGSAFEFHRNDAVGANTFFNNASKVERPKLIRNQFGFTLSGPVVIPKVVNG
ncbi:MAG TPA: carboxypeptidase-like regulatory domain-containing protein, partial [Acidobacteriota bacterium]|nr:carboxypeptidase-like regulatory domain-containing protein [Acidobacteriota bacterium]